MVRLLDRPSNCVNACEDGSSPSGSSAFLRCAARTRACSDRRSSSGSSAHSKSRIVVSGTRRSMPSRLREATDISAVSFSACAKLLQPDNVGQLRGHGRADLHRRGRAHLQGQPQRQDLHAVAGRHADAARVVSGGHGLLDRNRRRLRRDAVRRPGVARLKPPPLAWAGIDPTTMALVPIGAFTGNNNDLAGQSAELEVRRKGPAGDPSSFQARRGDRKGARSARMQRRNQIWALDGAPVLDSYRSA